MPSYAEGGFHFWFAFIRANPRFLSCFCRRHLPPTYKWSLQHVSHKHDVQRFGSRSRRID